MDRADARARQHRDRQLGDQRKIQRDTVAALHAKRLEHAGERAHLPVEIPVRQRPPIAGLSFPDERRFVPPRGPRVAVDAVDRRVQLAADEPLRVRRLPLEHCVPRLRPLQLAREPRPERFGVGRGARINLVAGDVRVRTPRVARGKAAFFFEEGVDFGHRQLPATSYFIRFSSVAIRARTSEVRST